MDRYPWIITATFEDEHEETAIRLTELSELLNYPPFPAGSHNDAEGILTVNFNFDQQDSAIKFYKTCLDWMYAPNYYPGILTVKASWE